MKHYGKNLEDIINEIISNDDKAAAAMVPAVRLYSFMILYKVTTGLLSKHAKEKMNIIQELKRNTVHYRNKSEATNANIVYNRQG